MADLRRVKVLEFIGSEVHVFVCVREREREREKERESCGRNKW